MISSSVPATMPLSRAVEPRAPRRTLTMHAIHQMLAGLAFGDAVGNDAREIRTALRAWGYSSELFAGDVDERSSSEARPLKDHGRQDGPDTGLILHQSIGGPVSAAALGARAKRMMIYHNITPAEFFAPYDAHLADLTRQGRAELRQMRGEFAMALADSAFNASELVEMGYANVRVLPILVSGEGLALPACPRTQANLREAGPKIIFVGRIAPNKKQDDLVRAFACYQRICPSARLYLVGKYLPEERYFHALQRAISESGATGVVLTGKVTQEELNAYYREADLFVSMSEHEGFGVPLVEAMRFGIPVLAYKCTAVPETMGPAGVLFTEKRFPEIAEMMNLLIEDASLRERIVANQYRRVQDFASERILPVLQSAIEEFARL
jgi:glycosyltransferase involved in cell wall biosynthesis